MNSQVKTVGVFYILFGMLGVVVAAFLFDALTGAGSVPGRFNLFFRPWGFGAILAALYALTSLPSIIAGLALLAKKSWAKPLLLILSFVNLFNIPLGLVLGIYALWTLMHSEAEELTDSNVSQ